MSLMMKRRMQERERRNGLADQYEEPHCYTKKPVEPPSSQTWSYMNNGELMPAATMPKMCPPLLTRPSTDVQELEHFQRVAEEETATKAAQPTMSYQKDARIVNPQRMPGWTLSSERPEQMATVENSNAMTLPQGSYYECPIIIDPASYQQQQNESFNVHAVEQQQNLAPPQQSSQMQQQPIQMQCNDVNCVHCKSVNVNAS